MYQTGRTQFPLASAPMQTAMNREVWAGAELGQWTPLAGYGAGWPAAPHLSQMQQAAALVTQPMHNEVGYQMVAVRDNGVPLGGTPATTPRYVTAGPIQPGYTSFVQPIMRIEQTPLAGRRRRPEFNPMPSDPSGPVELPIDPRSGPWRWNEMQGPTIGPMGGGPGAWPFVQPPPGYMMAGTNEGGWPVFALRPVAPPNLPVQVEQPLERAMTNPLPAALSGIPLAAASAGAGVVAGGATYWRATRPDEAVAVRRSRVRRSERDVRPKRAVMVETKPPGGETKVKIMQATVVPQQNPAVWPWVLGGFAALGAGAYGAWRCSPGQRLFVTDAAPGANVTRTLDFEGCFQEHPWRAKKITQIAAPGVEPLEETRSFKHKRDAMAWLYTGETPPQLGDDAPEANPRAPRKVAPAGYGMARRFKPTPDTCTPRRQKREKNTARSVADKFFNTAHRAPTSAEANDLINHAYALVYPDGPYPIPSATHPCAKTWLAIRGHFWSRIKHRIHMSKVQAAPRWWQRGGPGPAPRMANPIPGSVGYLGYFHGDGRGIPGSVGYDGYTPNPGTRSPEGHVVSTSDVTRQAGQMLSAFSIRNQASQQRKLLAAGGTIRTAAMNPMSPSDALGQMLSADALRNQAAQYAKVGAAGRTIEAAAAQSRVVPTGARPQWRGFRSGRRLTEARLVNPEACCDSCAIGGPCAGGPSHGHGHGHGHGPHGGACCASCAIGGPCEGACEKKAKGLCNCGS
jgi:hypothetical protein